MRRTRLPHPASACEGDQHIRVRRRVPLRGRPLPCQSQASRRVGLPLPGLPVPVRRAGSERGDVQARLWLTEGKERVYRCTADSGTEVWRSFCPICGTPLFAGNEPFLDKLAIWVGTLDDPSRFRRRGHNWVSPAPFRAPYRARPAEVGQELRFHVSPRQTWHSEAFGEGEDRSEWRMRRAER